MADEKGSGGSGSGRRRRRRGRGRGGAQRDAQGGARQSSSDASKQPGKPGGAKRSRRRRSGRDRQGRERGGDRARRGDGGESKRGARSEQDKAQQARAREPSAPPLSDVDLGWDDDPVDLPPEREPSRKRGPTIADSVVWGDDSGAPEPESTLSANLPLPVPTAELDPATVDVVNGENVLGQPVANIAGVRFNTAGKIYHFDAGDSHYLLGDRVSVEGDRGTRSGEIALAPVRRPVTRDLKRIVRKLSSDPGATGNVEAEKDALTTAKASARSLGLAVKIFRVEKGSRGKTSVYFSSEKKIEQRALARELAQALGGRVELRQTGVRDEAKIVGGIGSCGRELCCTTWLPAFVPVSIKNAKDQGLVLNPTKVSGQCGRLKCCLVYEQATYAEARKGLPKLGKRVVTDEGEGRVVEVDVLKRRIRVNHGDGRFDVYDAEQVKPMFPSQPQGTGGKKKRKRRAPADDESPKAQAAEKPAPTRADQAAAPPSANQPAESDGGGEEQ